jgi:predicted RND superfamily exporter protein
LLPVVLGLVWSAGILAMLRVPLDLFSMFGVLAFIGIGVDYGIHLVHRYSRDEDVADALAHVAPVNLIAGGIAVLGCGTLVTSSYPPLRSLGMVSIVTLVTCLAASLLVLPACLMSSTSRHSA